MARRGDDTGVRRRRSELTPGWTVGDGRPHTRLPRDQGDATAAAAPSPREARVQRREARWARPYPTVARRVRSSFLLVVVVVALGLLAAAVVGLSVAVLVFALIRAVNS